jgi:cell division protein FtsL
MQNVCFTESMRNNVTFKMTAFWDIALYSLVKAERLLIALMMEAICTSETSVYFKHTTRRYISEGYNLHISHHDNLKSHTISISLTL